MLGHVVFAAAENRLLDQAQSAVSTEPPLGRTSGRPARAPPKPPLGVIEAAGAVQPVG
jgi:hypothetical protein